MTPILIKSYKAGAAIAAFTLVKFDAADNQVVAAAAATDLIIGVSTGVASDSGEMCDVIVGGLGEVKAAGNITRGALVTANAAGDAVAAAPAAGVNNRVAGIAMASAVDDDIVPLLVVPHQIQGA